MNQDNNKIVNEDNNDNDDNYNSDNDDDDDDNITVKEINNDSKKIDERKSFEEQIDMLKKKQLNDYWNMFYYEDNKETNLRLFKLKFAHIFNDVNDNLFKEIFGHTSVIILHTSLMMLMIIYLKKYLVIHL